MDLALVYYHSATDSPSMTPPAIARFEETAVQAKAKLFVEELKEWPIGCWWKNTTGTFIPEPGKGVVHNWMNGLEWTGYDVHWYRNED